MGKQLSLEEQFEKLDGIVADLESPDISLEDSFKRYEEGMKLLKECNAVIDRVEKKVLQIREDGSLQVNETLDQVGNEDE
ncbi:MAG: exodeoxyribonuclease VII small subunit [Lachnospiraceae bacterium]|nr:exodeoxyribonuclease VII small subunit [Lachnospiraceae bacterium]